MRAIDDPFGLRSLDVEVLRRREGAKWQAHPARFAAWVADMDFPAAPAITDALREVVDRSELGYPNWGGPYALSPAAKLFPQRMADRFAWDCDPDRVRDLVDVLQGVRAAVLHCSEPGDGVVLHLPAYFPFLATIDDMGRRLVAVHFDDEARSFDYDRLDDELTDDGARVWILCHPQNPLGHVFERPELERIAELAAKHDLMVVSDEIHADLVMPGHGHVPFESLGAEVSARTVTVTSSSKAFNLAGLRWAVMHTGHAWLQRALDALPGHYLGAPNLMAVTATVAAWTDGDSWLDAVLGVVDENRRSLGGLLDEHLPGTRYTPPAATYLAWLDCRVLGLGAEPADVFRERGVELSPGTQFGPAGRGHVRLNLATSPSVLEAMVRAMAG
ncbi:MAG TPA: aminotransferase class I/II-fold pyridoxal phosphate-dependent enzyme [Ilumatobacter sp.]|nr:aminotransferase class I/II-fold pyridoxal phosphate-dependent enzyme [Ilumatobacter sp.]